jgi:hypothetical protein
MNSWKRISPWGILYDSNVSPDDPDAPWHAGRLYDVLRVGGAAGGQLLCASPVSGVWIVNESGGLAMPLSWNWPSPKVWSGTIPNVVCLAQGVHSPEHIYAGGGSSFGRPAQAALSETDTTQPAPLFHWRDIPIININANNQPLNTGAINRIVVVSELRKLVLACDNGVFWANIPAPGGSYSFQQVVTLPGQRFSGLALGPGVSVIAGAWGTDLGLSAAGSLHAGIFVGNWASGMGPLTFSPATIFGVNVKLMRRTDIASCAARPKTLYAVCGGGNPTKLQTTAGKVNFDPFGNVLWVNDDDFILRVLHSEDGGLTWHPTGANVIGDSRPLFPGNPSSDVAGHTQDGYVGCIGVSPFDPDRVAIGIVEPFLSVDHGGHWRPFTEFGGPGHKHRHPDTHGLVFDPSSPTTLHICCDGGLVTTPDLGATWHTGANRQLPNLEFYKVTPSPKDSGVVAGSLQDNGNTYAPLYITTDPWKALDDGDGVMTQFVSTGDLMRQTNSATGTDPSGTTVEYGRQVRMASWAGVARQFNDRSMFSTFPLSLGVIPVDGTAAGLTVPGGEDGLELTEPVATPTFVNAAGEPMVAVGASGLTIFGLFVKSDGNSHWQQLGSVPGLGSPPNFISAVASPDGSYVFAGTNNGNVFRLDAGFGVTNISDPSITSQVIRIVAFAPDRAFLVAGANVFRLAIASGTATWTILTGKVLPSGVSAKLPTGQQYNTLAADPTTAPPTVYVATAFGVFESQDNGDSWLPFMDALPTAPMCQDLRWVQESSGVTFLYLATQGWSVFRRALNVQEGTFSTLAVDGHMDLTDRLLLGVFTGDDYTFVPFMDSRVLGPFHPIDNMKFAGDETMGGEIHADMNLDLLWKVDSSVVVTWSADMKTSDGHSDSQTGIVTVPTSKKASISASLKTDKIDPDRASIELTATN